MMKQPKCPLVFFFMMVVYCLSCNENNPTKPLEKPDAAATKSVNDDLGKIVGVKFGKYGCTASHYSNGEVEYQGRGFLTLSEDGKYSYAGFKEPSIGRYSADSVGNLRFEGGYLDGGEATKIDRPNKFFLVFPNNPDNRWTCGWVDESK